MIDGRRVLVTGGAGFVGSALVRHLLDAGVEEVVVMDNLVRGSTDNLRAVLDSGRVTLVVGDICDRELVADSMAGVDLVFHQAALRITQCAAEPREALRVMVDGAFTVLEAAVEAGVRKVVAASSASVYGSAEEFPTAETHHPYANRTLYGSAKLFNEGLLRSFSEMYGLDYVVLRYFNVYGPGMDLWGPYTEVLVRWIQCIAGGRPPVVYGDGLQTMDLVFVDDVARANLLAAASPATDEVLNIGTGVEVSLNDLATALLAVMSADLEPEHVAERAVNPVRRRVADVRRARALLGFEAQVGLDAGLRRLVAWWRASQSRTPVGQSGAPA